VSVNQNNLSATLSMLSVAGFLFCAEVAANTKPLTDDDLASTAAQMVKKIPKSVINAPKPKRFSEAAKKEEDAVIAGLTESLTVIAERDPEDINTPKRPPMLVFRERLENERPSTPFEKAQFALCLIGLCGRGYGPDGAPVENRAYTRAEKKVDKSSLEISKQFTGTYQ
jgi:hypothetical protein